MLGRKFTQGRLNSGGARWVEATGAEAARDIVSGFESQEW